MLNAHWLDSVYPLQVFQSGGRFAADSVAAAIHDTSMLMQDCSAGLSKSVRVCVHTVFDMHVCVSD